MLLRTRPDRSTSPADLSILGAAAILNIAGRFGTDTSNTARVEVTAT